MSEGNKNYALTYGVDNQRCMSVQTQGTASLTKYYLGNYEEEVNAAGNVRKIHYLSGAILIQNNGKDSLLYTYTDNQGSLIALTDESGNLVERYAFDPWGARRNPDQWEQKDTRTKWRDTSDDWYYNQDSKTPIWSPLNIDIPGWNHGETVQSSGPDGIITYYPPDCPTAQYYAIEAVYSTFCPQGQYNSGTGGDNIVGDRTYSNSVGGASNPTVINMFHNRANTPFLSADFYGAEKVLEGNDVELTIDAATSINEAETTSFGPIKATKNLDGSGGSLGIGSIAVGGQGNLVTIDISQKVPFTNWTFGVTVSFDPIEKILAPVRVAAPETNLIYLLLETAP